MRIPRSSKLRLILAMGLMALPAALALALSPAGPAQAQASAGISATGPSRRNKRSCPTSPE